MVMRTFMLLTALLLSACGFHLRGQVALPFESLYLDAANPATPLIGELRRNLESNRVKLADTPDQAAVVLNIVFEMPDKQILSLGGDGRVNEFRLFYRVSFRAYDQLQDWIPAEEIALSRDYSYDDTQVLAKEAEEALLYQSMRSDMVQQIMRRLSRAKPQPE
jgi:LPS-assembly lipoprotein